MTPILWRDVTQVNNLEPSWNDFGERSARLVGTRVGAEASKVLVGMAHGELTPVASRCEVLKAPRRSPSAWHIQQSRELIRSADPSSVEWIFAKEILMLEALLQREPVADVEVQAIQVGPAVCVSNPGELFCQLGLDVKAGSPFPFTFPVELANGSVGYIPTREAFDPTGGGYETRLTSYSNLVIGAGAEVVAAGVRLARALVPGPSPKPPAASGWTGEWTYGNVPPELA